jgi:hypothetical protein
MVPGSSSERYYYANAQNCPVGPHTREELRRLLEGGIIPAGCWVITEGGTAWEPIGNILAATVPTPGTTPPSNTPASAKESGGARSAPASRGVGGLWALILFVVFPAGYLAWGQFRKGLVWLVLSVITAGIGWVIMAVDYWMCWHVQRSRPLGPWEWFPAEKGD